MQTYFEQLYYADETERPTDQDILNTIKSLTSLEIKSDLVVSALQPDEPEEPTPQARKKSKYNKKRSRKGKSASLRNSTLIMENLDEAQEIFEEEIMRAVNQMSIERLIGAVNRRLPEELPLNAEELSELEWDQILAQVNQAVNEIFNKRRARFSYDDRVGGLVERLENLFRYDQFVETATGELKQFFSNPAQTGIPGMESATWRSIGNQINIFIDRKKIAADSEINLLEETRSLLSEVLAELDPASYNLSAADWEAVKSAIQDFISDFYQKWIISQLIFGLRLMGQERKTVFDKGQKGTQTSNWFSYRHYAAQALQGLQPGEIKQTVLKHLQQAHEARVGVYGLRDWRKMHPDWAISDLPESLRASLSKALGEEKFASYEDNFIRDILPVDENVFIHQIGRYELSEFYREIFLRVISSLWIEYITEMEALRVKIGLEAYAQRDPLVAYKTQASEMFQVLFNNMQRDVVNRMFKGRGIYKGEKEERLALITKVRESRRELQAEEQTRGK